MQDGVEIKNITQIQKFKSAHDLLVKVNGLRKYMKPYECLEDFDNWTYRNLCSLGEDCKKTNDFTKIGSILSKIKFLLKYFDYRSSFKSVDKLCREFIGRDFFLMFDDVS